MSGTNPADVVPDGLTLEDLQSRQVAESSTPPDRRKRCPDCGNTDIVSVQGGQMAPNDPTHDYRCGQCGHTFDEPVVGER